MDELIGFSKLMQDFKFKIIRIVKVSGCVFVCGESGVGKEFVVWVLYWVSLCLDCFMFLVNCVVILVDFMESQFFGYKKGVFISVDLDYIGWFQQVDLGMLFFDEVGELIFEGQVKLFCIFEGYLFLFVGGIEEVEVDVCVIVVMNCDFCEYVQEKWFCEDFYYWFFVFELYVFLL